MGTEWRPYSIEQIRAHINTAQRLEGMQKSNEKDIKATLDIMYEVLGSVTRLVGLLEEWKLKQEDMVVATQTLQIVSGRCFPVPSKLVDFSPWGACRNVGCASPGVSAQHALVQS